MPSNKSDNDKRRSNRKLRTEVSPPSSSTSSSSSSSSDSEPTTPKLTENHTNPPPPPPPLLSPSSDPMPINGSKAATNTIAASPGTALPVHSPHGHQQQQQQHQQRGEKEPLHEAAFSDFYLKQATKEFANDLDKLRSAGDFTSNSVDMLIAGLKQGTRCFSREERLRVGSAGSD